MSIMHDAPGTLTRDRANLLKNKLAAAEFDAVMVAGPANVSYATGYRSVPSAVHGQSSVAVLVTPSDTVMIGPVADAAPAFEEGFPEDDFIPYGRFYFEAGGTSARAAGLSDRHPDYASALGDAVARLGLHHAVIGIDDAALPEVLRRSLAENVPGVRWSPASGWLMAVRSQKLAAEVDLLGRAAEIAEGAILNAMASVHRGVTEEGLARTLVSAMAEGGLDPRFAVVASGPRSALADIYPAARPIERGDLIRFDVGGTLDGYWSDIGRTAVVGEPTPKQSAYYAGLLAAEEAELALARPGVRAREVFDAATRTAETAGGPRPYRRHHCGHGIGLTIYEPPLVGPEDNGELLPGMVFCFETPFYELGWGGMMVEDAVVITETGCRRLTDRARDLTVLELD